MNNKCCDIKMISGNSVDIAPQGCDSEIKADIVVDEYSSVRLWGQILSCGGEPIADALIKLVRVVYDCHGRCVYQGISHTVSDCQGFYQFDLCVDEPDAKYKVLVNKTAVGTERIIEVDGGNCKACRKRGYTPCREYKHRVTPADHFDCNPMPHRCDCEEKEHEHHGLSDQCDCEVCNRQGGAGHHGQVGGNVYVQTKIKF